MKKRLKVIIYRFRLKNSLNTININWGNNLRCKKSFLNWLVKIYKYKNITINNFEYLFSKFNEITFPIYCDWTNPGRFIDTLGNEIYYEFPYYDYENLNVYTIWKKDSISEVYFDFRLLPNSIVLERMYTYSSNYDEKDYKVIFEYTNNLTNVSFEINRKKIFYLSYPRQNQDFDTKLSHYIFSTVRINLFDVFCIFSEIVNLIENIEHLHVRSFDENSEILSEILSYNGIVVKYCFTIKQHNCLRLNKFSCSYPISEFVSNGNKCFYTN